MNESTKPTIRAVVFDLDGLMFDTEALYFRVSSEMLAARGKQFTAAMMRVLMGRRAAEAAPTLKAMAEIDEPPEALLAEVRVRFADLVDTAVHPTPGLFVLLARLEQARLPLAVATSSRKQYAERLLARHGVRTRFAHVLAAEDVSRGKPEPEIYTLAAERLCVQPQEVLVLEDSPAGITAARAAGCVAVGVPHEHSPADGLSEASVIVPRLDDPRLLRMFASNDN